MIELTTLTTSEEPDLVLAHDEDLRPCKPGDPRQAGAIKVWMRCLTGGDDRAILNKAVQHGRRGKARFVGTGDTAALRLQRAVLLIEAPELTVAGEPISKLTAAVYDALPSWVIEQMRAKQAELQGGELEDDDDEDLTGE